MAISVFDLFSIGIGPSSSHTVGPMRAARTFALGLADDGMLAATATVQSQLFGSLGATGHGHGSNKAVLLGLEGADPETVVTHSVDARVETIRERGRIVLAGEHEIAFDENTDLVMHRRKALPYHPNGMIFVALDPTGAVLRERTYYSVGGGFVVDENAAAGDRIVLDTTPLKYPFTTGAELLDRCRESQLPISEVMLANELAWRTEAEIRDGLLRIWQVMQDCVREGCETEGILPGGLKVPRRAHALHTKLSQDPWSVDPLKVMDWVNLFALAVNEQNASGGRIVTAPTNGAAGIIPAVLHYYRRFVP
jgi:L-serine dehydratase